MLQPRREPDLLQEPLGAERLGELWVEDLERHQPVVPEVVRQVDRGHPPAAELALDRVAIAKGFDELGGRLAARSGRWGRRPSESAERRGPAAQP